jgi:aconitate hydratase
MKGPNAMIPRPSASASKRSSGRTGSPLTAAEKVLASHLLEGKLKPGEPIALRIDQTLTQDATGTMAWLQFEALGLERVRTQLSVSYVDHNTLQTGFESADDHAFLQSMAMKYGAIFSRPGNGICHQVHLERFGRPGSTLLGSDSHTPTAGGLGMLGIGAGGLDVAAAMGGAPFHLTCPTLLKIDLVGRLSRRLSAKDVILEILRRLSVNGGVGKILEYSGPGVATLTVPERATIANMGAETGATTSLFPSDEVTRTFLRFQGREKDFRPLAADPDAIYAAGEERIDLSSLVPLVAQPHSPDQVVPVERLAGVRVGQVIIGSCTNSSLSDLLSVAGLLAGRRVHPEVSLVISPGSQQVLTALARMGALAALIAAGARVTEPACGACIGMGQAPASDAVSLRTFNRNFKGRSGTPQGQVYLVSPETAAAAALKGEIVDPRRVRTSKSFPMPARAEKGNSLLLSPPRTGRRVKVVRGPNIQPLPSFPSLPARDGGEVLLKLGDHITTDDILPAGPRILPMRSNIPAISQYVFSGLDAKFAERAIASGGGYIVAGENYGQGSSREHAALAPRFLGIRVVMAKSFARIHQANLINFGIMPLIFKSSADYERIEPGEMLEIPDLRARIRARQTVEVRTRDRRDRFQMLAPTSSRHIEILLAGGLLNLLRSRLKS